MHGNITPAPVSTCVRQRTLDQREISIRACQRSEILRASGAVESRVSITKTPAPRGGQEFEAVCSDSAICSM